MVIMSKMLVNDTKSIFDAPKPEETTKQDLIKKLKSIIAKGGELSWFTTDIRSFEWSEINQDVSTFLKRLSSLDFHMAGIGIFYPSTKQTKYSSFSIIKSEK